MKKAMSLLLALVTIFSLATPCFALSTQKGTIEEAIALAEELYPGAEIIVDENEVLHILPVNASTYPSTRASQLYAPNGGRYSNFVRPPFTDVNAYAPLSIVFLPHEEADDIDLATQRQDLFEYVLERLGVGETAKKIVEKVFAKFEIPIKETTVFLYGTIGFYDAIDRIDRTMFNEARGRYRNICIQQLTLRGNIANAYLEWTGDYVSAAPFDNWNPQFNYGDYAVY